MAGFTDSGDEAPERRGAQDISPETLAAFRGSDESDEEFNESVQEIATEAGATLQNKPEAPASAASDAAAVDADDPPATEEEKTKLETALEALRRDGWTEEELNKLAKKTIISKGLKRAKVQADTDSMHADLRRMKSEHEKLQAKPGEPASPPADLAALAKVLADEGISEGVGKTLVGTLQSWKQAHDEEVSNLKQALVGMHVESQRREVAERFPDLRKPDVWNDVQELAEFFETKEPGKDTAYYIEKAARKHGLKPADETVRAEQAATENRAKKNGSPEVNGRKASAPAVDPNEDEFQGWLKRLRSPARL